MKGFGEKESNILLILAKDFTKEYNASSITKEVAITRQGAMKALKHLEMEGFLRSKKFGKATFYSVRLEEQYVFRTIETILMKDARDNAKRWMYEFEELEKFVDGLIIFGSILKNPQKANDIDLLIIFEKKNYSKIKSCIGKKNDVLLKPIHPIFQTVSDLKNNIRKKDEVVLNILKTGIIIKGQEIVLESIKHQIL